MKTNVFVYGTLKAGFGNHTLLADCEYIGDAETIDDSYVMFDCGMYPIVSRLNENEFTKIQGELYSVDMEIQLPLLDRLESHPNWYCRERESFSILHGDRSGEIVTAWVYLQPLRKHGEIVHSGEWTK